MRLGARYLFFCLLSFYSSTCIIYSSVCMSLCVCIVSLCLCVLFLCVSVCVCVLSVCVCCLCLRLSVHTRRAAALSPVCVLLVCACASSVLYFVRSLTVCPLLVSQTVYRSLSLYCAKVSARVGRRLAFSLFSECAALTC